MLRTLLRMSAAAVALATVAPASAAELVTDLAAFDHSPVVKTEWTGTVAYNPAEDSSFSDKANAAAGSPAAGARGASRSRSTLPEPLSWALMSVGLGVIGLSMRRRSHHTNRSFA